MGTERSLAEARANLPQILDAVYHKRHRCVVTKRGTPFGVIISMGDYQKLIEREKSNGTTAGN